MAVEAVVSRGFGDFSAVAAVPTRGYISGPTIGPALSIVTRGYGPYGRLQALAKRGYSSHQNLPEPPPTGTQYTALTSINALSHLFGTVAAIGDVETMDQVASLTDALAQDSGNVVTLETNGIVSIAAVGDTARRFISRDLFDVSLLAFDSTIPGTLLNLNQTPEPTEYLDTDLGTLNLARNVEMTSIDFAAGFLEPEGDDFTVEFVSGTHTGLDFVDNVLEGTPTAACGTYDTVIRATDEYGEYADHSLQFVIGTGVPDVDDGDVTQAVAVAMIEAAGLVVAIVTDYASAGIVGNVIAQSPAAGTMVDDGSTVTITVKRNSLTESLVTFRFQKS